MPCIIQPGGGGGRMCVCYTLRRKRGLLAAFKRMQAEGRLSWDTTAELRDSAANLSKWAVQGIGEINSLHQKAKYDR